MPKLEYILLYHICFDFATGQVNITAKMCNFLKCLNQKLKLTHIQVCAVLTIIELCESSNPWTVGKQRFYISIFVSRYFALKNEKSLDKSRLKVVKKSCAVALQLIARWNPSKLGWNLRRAASDEIKSAFHRPAKRDFIAKRFHPPKVDFFRRRRI